MERRLTREWRRTPPKFSRLAVLLLSVKMLSYHFSSTISASPVKEGNNESSGVDEVDILAVPVSAATIAAENRELFWHRFLCHGHKDPCIRQSQQRQLIMH